jgi:transposase
MFRPYRQDQMFLLPPALSDFIHEDHPAHLINDLVERLDLSALEARYGAMGQPAYAVRLMLKVILYGFTVGLFSARKLSRACRENLAFQYLAGLETPAFKTVIEFRRRHRDDMKGVFLQTVKLAREMGLVLLARVALDGSKITANTSKHKAMSYGRMQEEEKKLKAEIEALLKQAEEADTQEDEAFGADQDGYSLSGELARRESRLQKIEEARKALEEREAKDHPGEPIDPKKQISFADKDARCFAKGGDGARYIHNAQITVDMDSQIIVENHIEDSVSDANAAEPALQNMEESVGVPDKLVGDGGYGNMQTIESCERRGVEPVCATRQEETAGSSKQAQGPASGEAEKPAGPEALNAFSYDGKTNRFTCPHGVTFGFDHWNENGTKAIYQSLASGECACGTHQRRDGRRTLTVRKEHLGQRKLQMIMACSENKRLYRWRKCTVEPVLGQIKSGIGFDRFLYRGHPNVGSEWNVMCAAANLKKIAAAMGHQRKTKGPQTVPPLLRVESLWEGLIAYGVHLFRSWTGFITRQVAPKLAYV